MSLRYNALVMSVLIALLAIAGAWAGDSTFADLWRLPLGLLLLGLAYEGWRASRTHVQLALEAAPSALLGRGSEVRLLFSHTAPADLTVECAIDAPDAVEIATPLLTITAPPGVTTIRSIHATPRRLGAHAWPAVRARIAGPLGLAWWPRRLDVEFALHTAPDHLRGAGRPLGATAHGEQVRAARGAGAEVLQLRDYQPGDPLHLVDWKATARSGKLVSRDFTEDQHLDIVIAIDAGRASALRSGELDRLGQYANVAARFAEHVIAHEDRVGLLLFADRPLLALAPSRGAPALLRIRDALKNAAVVNAESNALNAALRLRSLLRHRGLIVLMTELDDATTAGHLSSAVRLLSHKHLTLIVGFASREIERLRHAPAEEWITPYHALAAQEYCASLERNVRALRALGAPALLTHPESMEQAVFGAYVELRRRKRI